MFFADLPGGKARCEGFIPSTFCQFRTAPLGDRHGQRHQSELALAPSGW